MRQIDLFGVSFLFSGFQMFFINLNRRITIKDNNKAIAEWNMLAYKAAEHIPREMVKDIKRIEITDRIGEAKEAGTETKGRFRKIVKDAAAILIRFVRKWDRTL
ncbi:MAG: hypothetical protein IKF90_16580, partial [Parasporobacterium sp.]|nr:hypothetical protein [Parasporobacterium sp.]